MVRIAFILLCHKNPKQIIEQIEGLTATGDYVAVHFDANADAADYTALTTRFAGNPSVAFAQKRVKCGWGEWSLVRATLNAVQVAVSAFPKATHFYMVSGDCMAIKSAAYARNFLATQNKDFIESFDFFKSGWIQTGIKEERLYYRHFFNERESKPLFYAALRLQRALRLKRRIPRDLDVMIGSQWWCLRRDTIEKILGFCATRPDVMRFFKYTWIPDETFFQTLVNHLVPDREIERRTLTFLMFSDYGMPATFYNDHLQMLLAQDYIFARKISAEASFLREALSKLWASGETNFVISHGGRRLYKFLRERGRIWQRFAPRFWERDGSIGQGREVLMIVCKKWHVAKRLLHSAKDTLGIPAVEYLYDEEDCGLPHLGGIERTLKKRNRHRRALLRMLFDYYQSDRLIICLDPNNIEWIRDVMNDRAKSAILEIKCDFDDDYLRGHAYRVGLASADAPQEVMDRMLPVLRYEFQHQEIQLLEAGFDPHYIMRQSRNSDENLQALAQFFTISQERAQGLLNTPHLFDD